MVGYSDFDHSLVAFAFVEAQQHIVVHAVQLSIQIRLLQNNTMRVLFANLLIVDGPVFMILFFMKTLFLVFCMGL